MKFIFALLQTTCLCNPAFVDSTLRLSRAYSGKWHTSIFGTTHYDFVLTDVPIMSCYISRTGFIWSEANGYVTVMRPVALPLKNIPLILMRTWISENFPEFKWRSFVCIKSGRAWSGPLSISRSTCTLPIAAYRITPQQKRMCS